MMSMVTQFRYSNFLPAHGDYLRLHDSFAAVSFYLYLSIVIYFTFSIFIFMEFGLHGVSLRRSATGWE